MLFLGWEGVMEWKEIVNGVVFMLVGGFKKYGGVDFGFICVKSKWVELGVDGKGFVD